MGHRKAALGNLKQLSTDGVRSPGWDLVGNVERAKQDHHPEPELLAKLARVISGVADLSDLYVVCSRRIRHGADAQTVGGVAFPNGPLK